MVSCQQPVQAPPSKAAPEQPPEAESPIVVNGEEVSTKPTLTGIPQIDYIWDPNLPRELNGFNMSNYPFLRSIPAPEKIAFKCDGLHDGFYASVPLKCQVYHQCLFGLRYDFLCANFTAFDQKNFICHFANEVDCDNSPLFFDRNEALYKTTTTTEAPMLIRGRFAAEGRRRRPNGGRRRRPQRPVYYDDYYEYDDEEYDDVPGNEDEAQEEEAPTKAEGDSRAKLENPVHQGETSGTKTKSNGGGRQQQQPRPGSNRGKLFNQNRPAPRIRPPVPNNVAEPMSQEVPAKKSKKKTTTPSPEEEEEEEEEEEVVAPPPPPPPKRTKGRKNNRPSTTTTTTTAKPQEEDYEYYDDEEAPPSTTTTTTQRPNRRAKMTSPPTTTIPTTRATTTTAATTEEPELPSKPNPSLFVNRKGPIATILKRRISSNSKTTTAPPVDGEDEEDFEEEEPVQESTTTTTTTTTATTTNPRRTTPSRPPRPALPQRGRGAVTTTPSVSEEAEEEAVVTQATSQSRLEAEPVAEEVTRARAPATGRIRPMSPPKRDDVAAASVSAAAPVSTQTASRQSEQQTSSRQGRDFEPEPIDDDEELAESQQWSVISLFSRVLPQRI